VAWLPLDEGDNDRPGSGAGRRGGVLVVGLVEPLTARELEVLGLVPAGASNRAIAKALVVAGHSTGCSTFA
jgi:DNA-binding NarL/FixJ family response regulator